MFPGTSYLGIRSITLTSTLINYNETYLYS